MCTSLNDRLRQIKMYKRQFYGVDHADNNGDEASSTDSSSLDTDSDAASGDEEQDVAKSAYVSSRDADSGVCAGFLRAELPLFVVQCVVFLELGMLVISSVFWSGFGV